MDTRPFRPEPMGLREDLLRLTFDARFQYDDEQNVLFLNFEKFEVKSLEMVEAIRSKVAEICEPLGHKVYAIVNYDGFVIERDVEDAYVEIVKDVVERYYLGVTCFTTSSFMRAKLSDALAKRSSRRTSTNPRTKHAQACAASAANSVLKCPWRASCNRARPLRP